uniref:Uncharacterized protein n=1 Tax=Chrysotila carterae TaxID=13221 RepID=A0A7S4BFI9_CHRCT
MNACILLVLAHGVPTRPSQCVVDTFRILDSKCEGLFFTFRNCEDRRARAYEVRDGADKGGCELCLRLELLGDAEIGDGDDAVAVEEHVGRLEVAVAARLRAKVPCTE